MAISFALLLHAHQPAGNFDGVIERVYADAYQPLVEALAAEPWLNFNLHYSGYLFDWLERRHPEHLEQVARLVHAGRVEVLGGGFYEPILPAIRRSDRLQQLRRLSHRLLARFGREPRGLWLAERVWEPELPETLATAGLEYTVLDDAHFLMAGLDAADLHGSYLTEAQGRRLRLIPSSLFLRQAIPFQPVENSIRHLREAAKRTPGSLLCMGDDLEKFGSWPQTHQHVFQDGWLRRFLAALESHRDEIETVRLGDYLNTHADRGPVYLPTASYPEMMRWAAGCEDEHAAAPWRAFLTRYGEANWLHKRQLDVSARLEQWERGNGSDAPLYREAYDALLAAQSNDAYWHGWFGGLYAPHLRDFLYTRLLQAERGLEELERQSERPVARAAARQLDLDYDGADELELRTASLRGWIRAGDGGTLAELDLVAADVNLINSLQRRPEPYHDKIRAQAAANPAGLPGAQAAPDASLAARLIYDAFPRAGGRLWLLAAGTSRVDFAAGNASDATGVAGGAYEILEAGAGSARLAQRETGAEKQYRMEEHDGGGRLELHCRAPRAGRAVLEMVFNFLAPEAPDRGWRSGERCLPLSYEGELPPGAVELWDGWRRIRVRCEAPGAAGWWVIPTYSVSQADTGFEAVYQGSSLCAIWDGASELQLRLEASSAPAQ